MRVEPRFLRVRLIGKGEEVTFPLLERAKERQAEAQVAEDGLDSEAKDDDRPEWVCPKCGETNPGNFNECWKCLAMRTET